MSQILIVENDFNLALLLSNHFSKLGHACKMSTSLKSSYELLDKYNFDLLILDRIIDDGDGLEIAGYLRDLQASTRVLFVSDMGRVEDKIHGLEQGGDDYLAKPFSITELSLRVQKSLASTRIYSDQLTFNDSFLDINTGTVVLKSGDKVLLRNKEAKILAILIRRKNQLVSREQIISGVWGSVSKIPTYATIDAYIRKIRMKLGSNTIKITTHRGIGYRVLV
jgi:DNA-binding response OmpR family regulator